MSLQIRVLHTERKPLTFVVRSGAVLAAVVYLAGATFIWNQERWARSPSPRARAGVETLYHPEAVLRIVREHSDGIYPNELRPALTRAMELSPTFYQGPLFYADFLAQRGETPDRVRALYEIALRRFPSNGRIHLAYAEWILASRSDLAAIVTFDRTDPLPLAERHMRRALELEPSLSPQALKLLARYRVPPERWSPLMPSTAPSVRALALALWDMGHADRAAAALRELMASTTEPAELVDLASRAVDWGVPELALDALNDVAMDPSRRSFIQRTLVVARAQWALDDPDAAYGAFRDALEVLNVGAHGAHTLALLCAAGDAYLRRSEDHLAESFYAEAAFQGEHLPALLGLASVYRRRGEVDGATDVYRRVLQLDPENRVAIRELRALGGRR